MRVKLGYVAIALNLPKITSSSTVTYTNYQKIVSQEKRLNKLKQVTLSNLDDLYKILKYNTRNNIHFYRITSHLVPLATHPGVINWQYRDVFKRDFERIGEYIKENNMRVDTHPDEFNVLNSVKDEVVESTKRNLYFHVNLFKDIDYLDGKMILHVGSSQGGRDRAIRRFVENFKNFPDEITKRIILENDDKTFNAKEVLSICKELNIPMVLDVHHHICNNEGENLEGMIKEIFSTWNEEKLPPKIHFSTPKEGEKDRKHADYIDLNAFSEFINLAKKVDTDFDIMIEAKRKDLALYKLVEDLKSTRQDFNWIDQSTFEI